MSLLENFPHRCTIRRRTRSKGELGSSLDSFVNEQTDVKCWEQPASHQEILEYERRGMQVSKKIYFLSDPAVTERHEILVTEKDGVTISSPIPFDVKSEAIPDATAGLGVVFKVMVSHLTAAER